MSRRSVVWALMLALPLGSCGGWKDPPERWYKPADGAGPTEEPPVIENNDPVIDCMKPFPAQIGAGACAVRDGKDGLFIHANILGPEGMLKGGTLVVDKD